MNNNNNRHHNHHLRLVKPKVMTLNAEAPAAEQSGHKIHRSQGGEGQCGRMSRPRINNRAQKDEGKTGKYGSLRSELKQQYPAYCVKQHNIIINVLGGWSREVDLSMRELFEDRGEEILRQMQEAIISSSLSLTRAFKVFVKDQVEHI